jgi:hypothetical protein
VRSCVVLSVGAIVHRPRVACTRRVTPRPPCGCQDLVAPDPGAALRHRTRTVLDAGGDFHDALGAAAAYEISTRILQL